MRATRRVQSFTGHAIVSRRWPTASASGRGWSSDWVFGNESLIRHLAAEKAIFYIRLKAGRYVELDGQRSEVRDIPADDALIVLFGLCIRVIRSPRARRSKEPWYILTNDFVSSRMKIVQIYYHRFEIEETFRDMKHIWELKRTRLNKPNSVKTILWFVTLGIAILYLITRPNISRGPATNPKKQRSWLRSAYGQLERAQVVLLWEV